MRRLLLWTVAAVAPLLGGCNYLAFPLYVFAPPEPTKTVEPEFKGLEKKTMTVIIWADTGTLLEYQSAQLELTDAIIAEFKRHLPTLTITEPRRVIRYQDEKPSWRAMQPRLLCDHFSSDLVMIVSLMEFTTREPGHAHLARGRIHAQAAIYQRERGQEPADQGPVWQNDGMLTVFPAQSPVVLAGDDWQIRSATEKLFAQELVRKFYKHEVPKE